MKTSAVTMKCLQLMHSQDVPHQERENEYTNQSSPFLGKGRIRKRGLVTGRVVTMKYKPHQMNTMDTRERGIHDMCTR